MGDLAEPVNDLDLVNMVNRRRQAAVHAKDGVVNHHRQGQKVEHVGKVLPHCWRAVLSCALEVEAVCLKCRVSIQRATLERGGF